MTHGNLAEAIRFLISDFPELFEKFRDQKSLSDFEKGLIVGALAAYQDSENPKYRKAFAILTERWNVKIK